MFIFAQYVTLINEVEVGEEAARVGVKRIKTSMDSNLQKLHLLFLVLIFLSFFLATGRVCT